MLARLFCGVVLTGSGLLAGCTSYVPREKLPFPLTSEEGDSAKVVTIPLPVIASSPNEGITAGALTAFLIHNKRDEINTLLAPSSRLQASPEPSSRQSRIMNTPPIVLSLIHI